MQIARAYFKKMVCLFVCLLSMHVMADDAKEKQLQKEVKANTDFLLGHVLQKAKVLQDQYGDFAPFGAGLFPNGEVKYVWLAKPGQVVNEPAKALPFIRQALRSQAEGGVLLGSAVVYKYGQVNDPQINVELEYVNGFGQVVGAKYKLDENRKISYGAAGKKEYKELRVFTAAKKD